MKNERAKNYVAKARQYLSLWSELYEKSPQSAIFNISVLSEDKRVAN